MKNSNDTIGNRTRDLLTCSAVPQPTAPPRSPTTFLGCLNFVRSAASTDTVAEAWNHPYFLNNNHMWVYPRVNERMILESTTTCFMRWGGTRRQFVNTWDCDLTLLITSWVRFVIFRGEKQKDVVSRSQPLLEMNRLVLSFAAATIDRCWRVLNRLFPPIWIPRVRPPRTPTPQAPM